jgi:hypothetical protein
MPKKKKPLVNIEARVSKVIKKKGVSKAPPKTDYRKKDVIAYVEKRHKGKVEVLSDSAYEKSSGEKQHKSFKYSEAERQYKEHRQNWYERYERVEGTAYKKNVPGYHIDKKTGEKTYRERTRTFYRWRDKETGRYISYDNKKYIRNKRTGELREKIVKGKALRDPLTGKFAPRPSVKESRKEMRKELAIHKMAERKRIPVSEARAIYEEFENQGMDRYLDREYARTPE